MNIGTEHLVCTNPDCRTEYFVEGPPAIHGQNPRCHCGADTRKIYHAPELRVLGTQADYLRRMNLNSGQPSKFRDAGGN